MILNLVMLAFCAAVTVLAVRFMVIPGIECVCGLLGFSAKTKGQIIGYATSLPEFVVVISAAVMGVFDAGFWNIASSNIINWFLFLGASLVYRQWSEMGDRKFIDELLFGVLSVGVPLTLLWMKTDLTVSVAAGLFVFFIVYKIIDVKVNPKTIKTDEGDSCQRNRKGLAKGIIILVLGTAVVIIAGRFLGSSAETLINNETFSIPSWLVGWILGFITSVPEMASFFEVFRIAKKQGKLELTEDTQEALDALVASNMSNLGVILPVGMFVFVMFS